MKVQPARSCWIFYGAFGLGIVWLVLAAFESLAPNALSARSIWGVRVHDAIVVISPQRWEFFTAPPQKAQIAAYRRSDLRSALRTPQSKADNAFGLSRVQRAQGPELAILVQGVESWQNCDTPGQSERCLAVSSRLRPQVLTNSARHKSLCGVYVVAVQKPTPFEFRQFDYGDVSIRKTAVMDVSCN